MSVVKRKTVVQLGSLGQHYKPSSVGSRGKMLEIFAYSAFWIAQNITLLALRQGILTKAYTINQDFWAFGGLSWGSQTSLQASKWLWIWHWCLCGWVGGGGRCWTSNQIFKKGHNLTGLFIAFIQASFLFYLHSFCLVVSYKRNFCLILTGLSNFLHIKWPVLFY